MNQALNLIVYRAITERVLIVKELPVVKGVIYKKLVIFSALNNLVFLHKTNHRTVRGVRNSE